MTTETRILHFATREFQLEIEPVSGTWLGLSFEGETILSGPGNDFDLRIDGWDALAGRRLLTSEQTALPDGWSLALEYELTAADGRACQATQTFHLFADRLERRLTLRCSGPGPGLRLLSATLLADGLSAGHTGQTVVSMPMTRNHPALPLAEVVRRGADFVRDEGGFAFDPAGLDIGLATLLLARAEPPLHVAVLPLPGKCPVKARLHGDAGRLVLAQEFLCESHVAGGETIEVAAQAILFAREPWQEALGPVGRHWNRSGYTPPEDRPAWAGEASILEVDLDFFGGLRALTARLDEIQELGFNTLYLMPWHPGHWNGYGTYRYDEINPAYGSFADLRALCDAAHGRGLRVLFDLLVNVAGEDSPYPAEHPDWFYRDGRGEILRHPAWNSWCFDPASPGFRRFLAAYALRCCEEWGADGFRVDAAAYRGGNWHNLPGIQPHEHSHAIFTLLGEIRDTIRRHDPEAICFAECFGPVQVPISDLVAYQWVAWLDWLNDSLLAGRLGGAALGRLLGEHFLAMPHGTWLVGYTHTHDTVAFEKRDLDGPGVAALFATLAFLCAGTMVFGGGWQMRARPGPGEKDDYRALFAARALLGGLASHEPRFLDSGDPALLIAQRPSKLGPVRVISNFSASDRPIEGQGTLLYSRLGSEGGRIKSFDTLVVAT